MNKGYFPIGMLVGILAIFYSCNSQNVKGQAPNSTPQEPTLHETKLDPTASIIYHDEKGNLWFVSQENGVYRYDGESLTLFTSNDGLGSYRIISVQEDSSGTLYFDTPEGVYKFTGGRFSTLPVVASEDAQNEWKIEPGDLWFRMGWDKSGPYRFDGENLYHLVFPKNKMEDEFYRKYPNVSFNPYGIYSLYQDSKGNIWFGTANLGIYLFDGEEISWMYENQLTQTPGGGDFGIRSIVEDEEGNYWICNAHYKYSLELNDTEEDGLKSIAYTRQVGIENLPEDDLYFF
ncbi:MAG: two-component regulator propeller domain-containing protein, partial [Bacteroidota bacterium]